jgi:hypothetical protein
MFGSVGTWETHCGSDARFNMKGSAHGMADAERQMDKAIRAKQAELGMSDADVDALTIEISFWKD